MFRLEEIACCIKIFAIYQANIATDRERERKRWRDWVKMLEFITSDVAKLQQLAKCSATN